MFRVSIAISLTMNIVIMAILIRGNTALVLHLNRPESTQIFYRTSIIPSIFEKAKQFSRTFFTKHYQVLTDNTFVTRNNGRYTSPRQEFLNTYSSKDTGLTQELQNKKGLRKTNITGSINVLNMSTLNDLKLENEYLPKLISQPDLINESTDLKSNSAMKELNLGQKISSTTDRIKISMEATKYTHTPPIPELNQSINDHFYKALDQLERKFYSVTFTKLTYISPPNRKENGISFVQSTLFLQLMLIAFSTAVHEDTRKEINDCLELPISYEDKIDMINHIVSTLPQPNIDLKFYWSSRLVLWPGREISKQFENEIAPSLRLNVDKFNGSETPEQIVHTLNHMVENDSGGAIHDTFDEDEISQGIQAIVLTTLYFRARWRSAPTLLNGTRLFKDSDDAPQRFVRCIRINDIMRYADLTEWDAEAVEIFYATPGLSLLLLIPRGRSLRRLSELVTETSIYEVTRRMDTLRIGTTLPLYTLRMTLLLPNKLEVMGISKLMGVNVTNGSFALSHAVQRIMFWAEAGRNAFKDDGIEWDEVPQLELVVDRPYIFFVRWNNLTIMNGNFVL